MFGKTLRRAALCRTSQLDRLLVTTKDAIGGVSVGPLLLLLSVGIGVARAEEAKPELPRSSTGVYVDVPMHGRTLNLRVDGSVGQPSSTPLAIQEDGAERPLQPTLRSRYVIVGYGVAGSAALKALLEAEPDAEVVVVEAEQHSKDKADLAPTAPVRRVWGFRRKYTQNVKYMWGTSVESIDVDNKMLKCSNGEVVGYGKVLLAMGSGPMTIPSRHVEPDVAERVMQLQRQSDREDLTRLVAEGKHVTILGSSWNAIELANHLSDVARQHGWSSSVTLIFPEAAPLAKQLPRSLAGLLQRRLERRGVEILAHSSVKYVGRVLEWDLAELGRTKQAEAAGDSTGKDGPVKIYLCSKFESLDTSALLTDRVVLVGSSIQGTNTAIQFQGRGLEVDDKTGAVVVNHELMASSSVLVAGDAAHFPCQTLGRMTVRSVDHAYHAGYVAGLNLAGREMRYTYMPIYFGAIPRLGVRAAFVGVCDPSFETHGFWWRTTRRREKDTTEAESETASEESVTNESLTEKVKGGLSKVLGDNPSGTQTEENQGRGVVIAGAAAHRDSHIGRKLGMRRFSTERETGGRKATRGGNGGLRRSDTDTRQQAFTPVNGTGVVFYVDNGGAIRGVLIWGIPSGDDDVSGGGLEVIDARLSVMVDRAKGLIQGGLRDGTVYKYDMFSRPETVSSLKTLATDVIHPEDYDALANKIPLYSYASARQLTANSDDPLFRASTNSKSAADALEAAYESVVRRRAPFS